MADVLKFYKEGYNCAESLVKAFNEDNNCQIPISLASPFGSGMASGATCGAITGAIIALGAAKGRECATEKNESRKYVKLMMGKLKEKYGTFECIELKSNGVTCNEIIEYTYSILNECLENEQLKL